MRVLSGLLLLFGLAWGATRAPAPPRCVDLTARTSERVLLEYARQASLASNPQEALCFAQKAAQVTPGSTTAWAVVQLSVGIYSEQAGDAKGAFNAYTTAANILDPQARSFVQWTLIGVAQPLLLEENVGATAPLRIRALQQARRLLPRIDDRVTQDQVMLPLLNYAAAAGDDALLEELLSQYPCAATSPGENPSLILARCAAGFGAVNRQWGLAAQTEPFASFERRWMAKGRDGFMPPTTPRQQAYARQYLSTLSAIQAGPPSGMLVVALGTRPMLYDMTGDPAAARKAWEAYATHVRTQRDDPKAAADALSRCAINTTLAGALVNAQSPQVAAELERARSDCQAAYPLDNLSRASSQSSLDWSSGDLAARTGRWADAERFYRRALAAYERIESRPGAMSSTLQRLLAGATLKLGDRAAAERIFRTAYRAPDPNGLFALNTLAFPADRTAAMESARAHAASEAKTPERQAQTLAFLALMELAGNDFVAAEETVRKIEAIQGADPWPAATTAELRAVLAARQGQRTPAFQALERAFGLREQALPQLASTAGGPALEALLEPLARASEFGVALCLAGPCGESEATTALTGTLRQKGRVLDLESTSLQLLRSAADPELLRRYEALRVARAQLAQKGLSGGDTGALAAEIARLQQELEGSAPALAYAGAPVSVSAVRDRLGASDALIEFVVYRPYNLNFQPGLFPWGAPRYAAAVLRPGKAPAWRDLGPVAELDPLLAAAREVLADELGLQDAEGAAQVMDALDARLLRPLEPLLAGATRWYLAPDGALNLLPFGALRDAKGAYRLEKVRLVLLTSGRELLRTAKGKPTGPDVLLGAPDYGPAPADTASDGALSARGQAFSPLPGTLQEVRALRDRLQTATLLTGEAATEAAIKALRGPRILHVATHGFFLTDSMDTSDLLALTLDPMLRSGLALAGANVGGNGSEDGLLTALETAGLDLRGTELVVLSACETGVGTVRTGEGVQGMRRALTLAGARTEVLSLWKVDDEATLVLMQAFYSALLAGTDRAEALRKAQLTLSTSAKFSHPTYWAAWVLSGEDGPLLTR